MARSPARLFFTSALLAGFVVALPNPARGHVTLIDPDGGEVLEAGSVFIIEWTVAIAHDLQNWDLWYSTTGASGPWIIIAMDLPPGSPAVDSIHTYNWTVPDDPSVQVRVRVRMDNSATDYEDISNGDLTIPTTHHVVQVGLTFDPADIVVAPGDTVEWHWTDGLHTVTSGTPCTPDGRFDELLDVANQLVTYKVPLNELEGVIPYYCIPHCFFDMTGTITVQLCAVSSAPQPDVIETKNRYLSFSAGDAGLSQAVRVTFRDLPDAHASLNGTQMWVQSPDDLCENSGQVLPPCAGESFKGAGLGCTPHFMDWSTVGVVHVSHAGIVPGGRYDIQVVEVGCGSTNESGFSASLALTNAKWGDCCGAFVNGEWSGPNGTVDVTQDVVGLLDKFRNLPGAPIKSRVDLEPSTPDRLINITDVTRDIDSFRGFAYPFPPGPAPCG